jgi:hypothetical protein
MHKALSLRLVISFEDLAHGVIHVKLLYSVEDAITLGLKFRELTVFKCDGFSTLGQYRHTNICPHNEHKRKAD